VTKPRKPPSDRRRAKAEVGQPKTPSASELRALHELEVHQVELELQNEELRTARQRMETALERYTEVFDFAPLGYATFDLQGNIIEINYAGAILLGADRSTFVGKRFALFVASRSLPVFDTLLNTASGRMESANCELDLRRGNEIFPARLTAAVLRRVTPIYMVAFEDISARREKERELARTEAALRDLNRRKDDFVAMLSHELRNPLAPIRTSVEVLRLAAPGSDAANSAIDIIDRSSAQMRRLVNDLLDVSRVTRGKVELQREPVDLVALVRQVVEDHETDFARRRFKIAMKLEVGEIWMHGDRARLVQVMTNVLSNAEKFTPSGGRIAIDLQASAGAAVIRVQDTGIGLAPDVLVELFQPFVQAPQTLDRNRGGLGLGLVMVKQLIELHGGRVAISSPGLGKGTEVTITLPAHATQLEAPRAMTAMAVIRRRVLIVEDVVDNATSLQQALTLKGHDVRIAHDGGTGLARMAELKPDVVLCDIGLPDMDGYAFALRVREDRALRSCYLVALSGYARPQDVARAHAAGFDRHLAKPASLDELDRLLATLPASATDEPRNTLH
jgi:two-component system, chemotaxis family, CheB/CheR fusion protein